MHVAAGTEGFVADPGKDDHTDVLCFATIAESLTHLPCRERCKGIAVAFPVDGYLRNVIVFLEEDFLEIKPFNLFPFSCHSYFV